MEIFNWLFDTQQGNTALFVSLILGIIANSGVCQYIFKKVAGDASHRD